MTTKKKPVKSSTFLAVTFPCCGQGKDHGLPHVCKQAAKPSTPAALYELAALERGEALKTLIASARRVLLRFQSDCDDEGGIFKCPPLCEFCDLRNTIKEVEAKL